MKITFLGTSSGVPTISRNVSALALKPANEKGWYLVDCGEGTQQRILSTSYSLSSLHAIFITHMHGDHCFGLPGLLASSSTADSRTDQLIIAGPAILKEYVALNQKATFSEGNFPLSFINMETGEKLNLGAFSVHTVPLSHRIPSYAYIFTENNVKHQLNSEKLIADGIEQGAIWGRLQKGNDAELPDGRILRSSDYLLKPRKPIKIIAAGDNDNPDLLAQVAEDSNLLIHEATYTEEIAAKNGKEYQHSSARAVAEFAQRYTIPNLILTHFSPRYRYLAKKGNNIKDIEEEAAKYYDGNLFLANDLDTFFISKEGTLRKKE